MRTGLSCAVSRLNPLFLRIWSGQWEAAIGESNVEQPIFARMVAEVTTPGRGGGALTAQALLDVMWREIGVSRQGTNRSAVSVSACWASASKIVWSSSTLWIGP